MSKALEECARIEDQYYYYYYYVFILSAISPYTTGLKALFNQSDCTGTAPTSTHPYWTLVSYIPKTPRR